MVGAARPIARTLDVELPARTCFADVQRLVRNLIAMNEILRDRERASIRLVMNPDRMVIKEAQRTFTYLNLYGYLTDAVIVNRVFPDEVADGYFGAWRERQREQLESTSGEGFAPVPVLTARYFEEEVIGPGCSTASAPSCSARRSTRRRSCTPSSPRRSPRRTGPRSCGSRCRSPSGARSR